MITIQSMDALVAELEKTSGLGSAAAEFAGKHSIPTSLGAARSLIRGRYGTQMLMGAGAGGVLGGLRQPGYEEDDQGGLHRRSRIGNIAQGALLGAGAVGVGALATKGGRAAAKSSLQNFGTRTRYQFTGSAPNVSRMDLKSAKQVGLLGKTPTSADNLAHAEGWNTIPGVAKGMVRDPKRMLGNAWNRMDWLGKTVTGLQAADTVHQAVLPTEEGGPGKAERILGSAGSLVGNLVAPSGVLPSLAVSGVMGVAGNRLGRLADRTFSRAKPSLQPPQQPVQQMAPPPAAEPGAW
jgi:hypothetical protein